MGNVSLKVLESFVQKRVRTLIVYTWAFMRGSRYVYKVLTKKCLVFLIGDHLWEETVYKSWFQQR